MIRHVLEIRAGGRSFPLLRDPLYLGLTYRDYLARADRIALEREVIPGGPRMRFEVPSYRITMVDAGRASARVRGFAAEAAFQGEDVVETILPVFVLDDKRVVLTSRMAIRIDPDIAEAARLVERFGLKPVEARGALLIADAPPGTDTTGIVQLLAKERGVLYAEPDFVTIGRTLRPTVSRPVALAAMREEVQPALIQVRADAAWKEVDPSPAVRIAVLDSGIDTRHPALAGSLVAAFDAMTGAADASSQSWEPHGTACAGLALGLSNDPPFSGVAAGCSLLAVRVARSPAPGAPWATSNSILRRGLDWAVDNGADVISNSWGGGPPSNLVAEGVVRALSHGRAGRGCIVVFAAGNDGGRVEFPGSLRGVIAVAGVNGSDEHKTRTSSDGESWWSSNVGPEIDLAAPSVGLLTTDNLGPAGRTPSDYRSDFNGTSAATPIVAGAAALLLSANPTLTHAAVHQLLTTTADKVGTDPYNRQGRNDTLGSGRLNIKRAVDLLRSQRRRRGLVVAVPLDETTRLYVLATIGAGPAILLPGKDGRLADVDAGFGALAAAGRDVDVAFSAVRASLIGEMLVGAQPPETADNAGTGSADEPPLGEVRLPRPEENVFAGIRA